MKLSEYEALPWDRDIVSSNICGLAFVQEEVAAGPDLEELPIGTLYVEFIGGRHGYCYLGVPVEKYEEMLAAESVGGYFAREIKPHYACWPVKLDEG